MPKVHQIGVLPFEQRIKKKSEMACRNNIVVKRSCSTELIFDKFTLFFQLRTVDKHLKNITHTTIKHFPIEHNNELSIIIQQYCKNNIIFSQSQR